MTHNPTIEKLIGRFEETPEVTFNVTFTNSNDMRKKIEELIL
jgi:hypothetical protein